MMRSKGLPGSTARSGPLRARVAFILGAVIVALSAFWVAELDPAAWIRAAATKPANPHRAQPHLEGPITVVQPMPLGTDSSVSTTPLPLHLTATRPGRNAHEGYADIGVDLRTPQTYRAGALLANGAQVDEIHPHYVLLVYEGHSTRLYVEGKTPPGYRPSASAASMLTVGGSPPRSAAMPDSADALTDVIRVSPVYQGETLKALQVYGNEHSDVFARLGLEPGDLIRAIDGEPVRDAATAVAALRHLTEGQALTVEVERAGEAKTLSLDGAIIVAGTRRS